MTEKKTVEPQIKRFKLSELRPAKYNPRVISDDALQGLAESTCGELVEPIKKIF